MSTRYNLNRAQEDAYATDCRTGKKVCLLQKIKGTDYWIAEDITDDDFVSQNYPYIVVCEYELDDIYHY